MMTKLVPLFAATLLFAPLLTAAEQGPPAAPEAVMIPGPLKPSVIPEIDQSVILGRSGYYSIGEPTGTGDASKPWYEPVEEGGFRVTGSQRVSRPIVSRRSVVTVGDAPVARISTYSSYGVPYWKNTGTNAATNAPQGAGAADAGKKASGPGSPIFGTLRIGVQQADGKQLWFDKMTNVTTTHWPGYSDYEVTDPAKAWTAHVRIAPVVDSHSLVCRVEFDGAPQRLIWSFGGIAFDRSAPLPNHVSLDGRTARLTEPQGLAGGLVLAGWDVDGKGRVVADNRFGQICEFVADQPHRVYHVCTHWGVTDLRRDPLDKAMETLAANPASAWWPRGMKDLRKEWKAGFLDPVLEPEAKFRSVLSDPEAALSRTVSHWDRRRREFVVRTPDRTFNALMNFARCITDYNKQGAGYYLSAIYPKYMHISTGWYGKEWGGDHADNEMNLRMYATLQFPDDKGDKPAGSVAASIEGPRPPRKGGYIGWGNWEFVPFHEENNTAFWVDQVWQNYRWTGNRQFLKDMWPHVVRAVDWELCNEDPDGDGLFRSDYEFWNCDSGGKGPKGAAPTAICYGMLDSASKIASEIGEKASEEIYRKLAEKTRLAARRELWDDRHGVLATRGADDIIRHHPQGWDESFAMQFGLLDPMQSRRAMRWIESHHGFTGDRPDVRLLMTSDWWPHRWSNHWVPVGDTLLSALAGMKAGDPDLWWPYVKTVTASAYRNNFPGIGFSISNKGAAGGDMEDVDGLDPHPQFVVRGLFGIEPDIHQGIISICPSFPSDWREASITTPDISYEYRREGDTSTFRITTPRPLVKHVRANLTGEEKVTSSEKESVVTVKLGPKLPDIPPTNPSTILAEREPAKKPAPLTGIERARLVPLDLSRIYNSSQEEMTGGTKFIFDHDDDDHPKTIGQWWKTPTIELSPMPREITTSDGVKFLTAGRDASGNPHKSLLALSSWKPHLLPAGAEIPIGRKTERLWLLLQSYVHPANCYIPNGEVILHYSDGTSKTIQLIPPFNLDCYYQHFSLEGMEVNLGKLVYQKWSAVRPKIPDAHADSLVIPCDPSKVLKSVELRSTCSEAVLGLVGLTLLPAP